MTVIGTESPALMKKEASITSSGSMHRNPANLQQDVARLQARAGRRCAVMDFRHLGVGTSDSILCRMHVDPDPAVTRIAEAHVVAPNFFRGVDWQGVTSRAAVHTADKNADDFTL